MNAQRGWVIGALTRQEEGMLESGGGGFRLYV